MRPERAAALVALSFSIPVHEGLQVRYPKPAACGPEEGTAGSTKKSQVSLPLELLGQVLALDAVEPRANAMAAEGAAGAWGQFVCKEAPATFLPRYLFTLLKGVDGPRGPCRRTSETRKDRQAKGEHQTAQTRRPGPAAPSTPLRSLSKEGLT